MKFRFSPILVCLLLFLFSICTIPALAQAPPAPDTDKTELVGAGGSYNQTGIPQFSLNVYYGHKVAVNLYSFTFVDIFARTLDTTGLPANSPRFSITTAPTTGLAQKLRDIGPIKVYVLGTIGGAAGGTNVGWSYTTGGFAYIPIRKDYHIILNFRALKSSITEVQGIYGVAFGWGK